MMLRAHTETVREKGIRSLCHPTHSDIFGELTFHRDLAESLERIDILENENQELLNALRSLATSPNLQQSEHNHIVEILSKV